MNCSYYSALGNDDEAYLLARAIQFFTPGIPLVYYVGLLAGANDIERVESTKVGRDINRHPFTEDEAVGELERPVVQVRLHDFNVCKYVGFWRVCACHVCELAGSAMSVCSCALVVH